MKRTPEPELMDSFAQVAAYAAADFAEGNQAFAARVVEALRDIASGRLIDLGCGPGDICRRIAAHLKSWRIEGLDAGPNMLDTARRHTVAHPAGERIDFRLSHLPDDRLPEHAYQAVVSNSLLHHLPEPAALWSTIRRIGAPGAYVQVMDLERPSTRTAAKSLVEQYAIDEPTVLREDFLNSLHAAYTAEEVEKQLNRAGLLLAVERISDRHWLVQGHLPD